MFGVLITLVVAKGGVGIGTLLLRRWMEGLDPVLRFGVGGLVGLGVLGTLTFFLGLIPGGFNFGVYVVAIYALAGLALLVSQKEFRQFRLPRGAPAIGLVFLVLVSLFSLVSVLAPSSADDWDTLAYHLAVPKLWLAAGHMFSVTSLHHSNFPDVIDDLYVWGLTWGGESGAKAFSLTFFLLGIAAVFGFARSRYGEKAAWWAAVAFASTPALIWESGTAYIDLGHGLFAGLGIAFAALAVAEAKPGPENGRPGDPCFNAVVVSAVLLGFAAASKYTGLEAIFVVAVVIVGYGFAQSVVARSVRAAVAIAVVAVAIAAPWYIKNAIVVGNPVYPFLYERLGGANWDQRRADIYRVEQQSFGVGLRPPPASGRNPLDIGHAILGLAYQPGRYVNPGQTSGLGSPEGAIGVAVMAGLLLWPIFGLRKRRFEGFLFASVGLTLLMWFFLSQQSRYLTTFAPLGAILIGGAVVVLPMGAVAAAVVALQGGYSLWLFQSRRFTDQIPVVLGRVTREDYESHHIPFYAASVEINRIVGKQGKVALYDEVFGYLLDVPYMWANPGHSTIIPYDRMTSGDDFVDELKRLGFTHVYINLSPQVKEAGFVKQWLASMGLGDIPAPLPPDVRASTLGNWQTKWEVLLADAVAAGKLHPVQSFRSGVLFSL